MSYHIKDINKRNSFINGNEPSDYIIHNLDLREIIGYNFDDGNSYLFKECMLENVDLQFKNDALYFDSCFFAGNVSIHNQGIGKDDIVVLKSAKNSDKLANLTVKSTEVNIENSNMDFQHNMSVTANTCIIEECSLIAGQVVDVYYLSGCTARSCNISRFIARTSPIINPKEDKPFLIVENSVINGQTINSFDSDINSIDDIPVIKQR
jgi:hypothetical protein